MIDNKDFLKFINTVKHVNNSRIHKVRNSYGIYDGYKYYRKNKPNDSKYILTESQYFAITRKINNCLKERLISGEDVSLPCRMGRLELRKRESKIEFKNGKLVNNLPIDWDRTLKLWYEDEESYKDKVLVKLEDKEIFRIYYNRNLANYNNKSFYQFKVNRDLKDKLKLNIKEGNIDAFLLNKQ